jgi:cellobiose epimerase
MMDETLSTLAEEAHQEVTEHILPFWMAHAVDSAYGGFVGRIDGAGCVVPDAPKGAVLNARILWTFSASARVLEDGRYRTFADRAFRYLCDHFVDPVHGGVFWTVAYDGAPLDTRKQVYAQAFAIYGLAEYVRLTGSEEALALAVRLVRLLEERVADPVHGGYFEAFEREWEPAADLRLSEKDLAAPKSMNTHLHVLEAYTALYRVWPDPELAGRLRALIEAFLEHIIDPETHHQRCFFSADWRPLSSAVSFGHDIEASWLLDEATETLGDPDLCHRVAAQTLAMAREVLEGGLDPSGGLLNEVEPGEEPDTDRYWWPQAEAVVGFLSAYRHLREEALLQGALKAWGFIRRALVDRQGGEWFERVTREGLPYTTGDKVNLWKCPYHNGRACLEILERVRSRPVDTTSPAPFATATGA